MFDKSAESFNSIGLITIGIGLALGVMAYGLAKSFGPLFPLLLFGLWSLLQGKNFPIKTAWYSNSYLSSIGFTLWMGWIVAVKSNSGYRLRACPQYPYRQDTPRYCTSHSAYNLTKANKALQPTLS